MSWLPLILFLSMNGSTLKLEISCLLSEVFMSVKTPLWSSYTTHIYYVETYVSVHTSSIFVEAACHDTLYE